MRCYFMKGGHIAAVEFLPRDADDAAAILAGKKLFQARSRDRFDGFEIWDQKRLVFRYPEEEGTGEHGPRNGQSGRGGSHGNGSKALPAWMAQRKGAPSKSLDAR